ncbi:MAG TPA: ABC transporter substrate-binding protein [Dehalococcoidia bacterium]|nr:ABC transporter substrate-binding protein [Dehalococcoidia bacterium]
MRINIRGRMQIYATGIIGLFVLTAGCGGSYSQPVAAPTASANTSTTLSTTATARAEESSSAESPSTRTTRTFTLAASDVTFPAMVPSQLPVAPSGFMRRWGVYETAMVWAVDRPELEFRLITGWELDPDGRGWTLELKHGVQFHGSWGEMTADDFVWSFEDEIRDGSIHSGIGLARATGATAEAVDNYTVSFRLDSPNSFFFDAFFGNGSGASTKIFSKNRTETLGVDAAFLDLSGGTGPFVFKKWAQGDEVVLEAFEGYHGTPSQLKTVRILEIKEPATQIAALKSGQVDASLVPAPLAEDVASDPSLDTLSFGVPGSQRLYPQGQFCMETTLAGEPIEPYPRPGYDPSKPWVGECDNPDSQENARKVRMAMSMAIDRQSIVDNILGGFGRPSYLPEVLPPLLDLIWQDKWFIPYDPDTARELLVEAGYPDGIDALIRITTGSHPLEVEMGQAVAQFLGALGGDVRTEVLTYSGNRPSVVARERSDLWFRSSSAGTAEPPELTQLRRNPENAFNPGLEVREPLAIIRLMDSITSREEIDKIRERLYDGFNLNQWIIPVVLADQILGINSDRILEWKMTTGSGYLGDFENIRFK